MVTWTLPAPPSANNLYGNSQGGGRHKTERYKAWLRDAGWTLKLQRPPFVPGPFSLTIWTPARIDIDNLKAVADLIQMPQRHALKQSIGLVENDVLMQALCVYRDAGPFRISYESVSEKSGE